MSVAIAAGPWGQAGHFGKFAEAAQEYTSNFSPSDELWALLYEDVCFDWYSGRFPPNFGTQEHSEHMFMQLKEAGIFMAQGEKSKLARWFQYCRRYRQFRRYAPMLLLVLIYMGLHLKWWKTLRTSPLRRMFGDQAPR